MSIRQMSENVAKGTGSQAFEDMASSQYSAQEKVYTQVMAGTGGMSRAHAGSIAQSSSGSLNAMADKIAFDRANMEMRYRDTENSIWDIQIANNIAGESILDSIGIMQFQPEERDEAGNVITKQSGDKRRPQMPTTEKKIDSVYRGLYRAADEILPTEDRRNGVVDQDKLNRIMKRASQELLSQFNTLGDRKVTGNPSNATLSLNELETKAVTNAIAATGYDITENPTEAYALVKELYGSLATMQQNSFAVSNIRTTEAMARIKSNSIEGMVARLDSMNRSSLTGDISTFKNIDKDQMHVRGDLQGGMVNGAFEDIVFKKNLNDIWKDTNGDKTEFTTAVIRSLMMGAVSQQDSQYGKAIASEQVNQLIGMAKDGTLSGSNPGSPERLMSKSIDSLYDTFARVSGDKLLQEKQFAENLYKTENRIQQKTSKGIVTVQGMSPTPNDAGQITEAQARSRMNVQILGQAMQNDDFSKKARDLGLINHNGTINADAAGSKMLVNVMNNRSMDPMMAMGGFKDGAPDPTNSPLKPIPGTTSWENEEQMAPIASLSASAFPAYNKDDGDYMTHLDKHFAQSPATKAAWEAVMADHTLMQLATSGDDGDLLGAMITGADIVYERQTKVAADSVAALNDSVTQALAGVKIAPDTPINEIPDRFVEMAEFEIFTANNLAERSEVIFGIDKSIKLIDEQIKSLTKSHNEYKKGFAGYNAVTVESINALKKSKSELQNIVDGPATIKKVRAIVPNIGMAGGSSAPGFTQEVETRGGGFRRQVSEERKRILEQRDEDAKKLTPTPYGMRRI